MSRPSKAKRKKLKAAIQILLLTGIIISTCYIKPAKAHKTITIASDGQINPSTAPIQHNGDIYTLTSNINETIAIQRNNTVFDGNGYTIQSNGAGQGVILDNVENVTVKNTKITGFSQGIQINQSPKDTITNNTITRSTYGILIDQSPRTKVDNNTVKHNNWDGIFITASPYSQIINNTVANHSKWGIYLGYSAEATLRNNTIKNSTYNFGVSVDFVHDIDNTNTVDGKPIYYWINQQNTQIPANAGYVAIVNCINIEIRNLDLAKNGQGIIIINSASNLVENSKITGNGYYGIHLINSNYNIIRNNTIANNVGGGGIALISSASNTVSNNTIEDNKTGINLQDSNGNHISHNNFINNTRQAINKDSANVWDDNYPSGGNYWSDYKGVDADGDGIGNTPYIIDNENQDNYPLMHVVQTTRSKHTQTEPILVITGISAIVSVALLTYLIRKRKTHFSAKLS